MKGKGLSKPLMTTVRKRMCDLDYGQCYLTTSTVRIRLYLKFGIVPESKDEKYVLAWYDVLQRIIKSVGEVYESLKIEN